MSKVLKVTGDDFAALQFEQQFDIKKVYQDLIDNDSEFIELEDKDGEIIEVSLYEFTNIDPKFVDFIKNDILDHDEQKTTSFYVID